MATVINGDYTTTTLPGGAVITEINHTPPPPGNPTQISRLAFRLRFTGTERQDLLTLAKANVQIQDWIDQVSDAEYIDLLRADTQANVKALESVPSSRNDGTMVLAAGRASQILTP